MHSLFGRLAMIFQLGLFMGFFPIGLAAPAAPAHPNVEHTHRWNWLSEEDKARLLKSIPPSPPRGSDIDRKDLAELLQMQATRTPQDIAEAFDDKNFRLEMVSGPLGPGFTPANYPMSFALLSHAMDDEGLLNSTLKKRYQRLRPYQEHPEVKPLFTVDQYSYPSGHSSGSQTMAGVLGGLFPEKKSALTARADAVGRSRVVAGVHYPSDVAEGKKLAEALLDALVANPAFQKDLAAAKAEVAQRKDVP